MNYIVSGISPDSFRPFFDLTDEDLTAKGIRRCIAEDDQYPCRVSLAHAAKGEELLLLSYEHQDANSPYRAKGPIFVRKAANEAAQISNQLPQPFLIRLLSVRAYDKTDAIIEAEVVDGNEAEALIIKLLMRQEVTYIHVHYARRGCYAGRIDRV
jgi:Protein of unknown function (DUF1203)